jgi:hypothetical protein
MSRPESGVLKWIMGIWTFNVGIIKSPHIEVDHKSIKLLETGDGVNEVLLIVFVDLTNYISNRSRHMQVLETHCRRRGQSQRSKFWDLLCDRANNIHRGPIYTQIEVDVHQGAESILEKPEV